MLASGGYDSTVALWDIVGDEPVQKLRLQVNMMNLTIVLNAMLTKIAAKGSLPPPTKKKTRGISNRSMF